MIAPRSFVFRALGGFALLALLVTSAPACRPDGVTDLDGHPADPFTGGSAASAKATVLVFVSTDCPISNRYAPELRRLYERYAPQGIAFRLVYPTVEESPAMIRAHVREYGFPFDALRDPGHSLVARAKATVTPESAVFARGGALVYHGRIDDRNVDLGEARPEPTRRDLEEALDAVVAGRAPAESEAPAVGCAIAGAK